MGGDGRAVARRAKTQLRSATKRVTVAAVLAAIRTASSTARGGVGVEPVQHGERAARQPEREHEDDRAERVLAQQAGAAAERRT